MPATVLENGDYSFSEVHVVSDLHLGGIPGRQIFSGTAELVGLIELLRVQPTTQSIALVINGDFIDFLAEEPNAYFDPNGATKKIDRIRADPSFEPIWRALHAYLETPNRYLALVLGNHDVELALPHVLRHLVETLVQGNETARGRLILSTEGHGFAARVGGKRIVCVHGNETDTWNVIDYDRVRRIGNDLQLRSETESWTPNAGTKLVIDVMNAIKRDYPFVDLLKPETAAVIPILWALDQGTAKRLGACMRVAGRLAWDKARRAVGLLSAQTDQPKSDADDDPAALRALLEGSRTSDLGSTKDMIRAAIRDIRNDTDPLVHAPHDGELSIKSALWARLTNKSPSRVAFEAVESVASDRSFLRGTVDSTFEQLDSMISDADVLIAGHTHLERDLMRVQRPGRYFNTGTWARLIRTQAAWVTDESKFQRVWEALKSNTIAALDAVRIDAQPLVMTRRTVASMVEYEGGMRADLHRIFVENGAFVRRTPKAEEE